MQFSIDGVVGDGFVDFTKLVVPPGSLPYSSAPIPVNGIPGLTATFQLPADAYSTRNDGSTGGPSYQPNSPASLTLLSSKLTVRFNRPVQGVSVQFRCAERFGHNFTMTANYAIGDAGGPPAAGATNVPPPTATVSTSGLDWPSKIIQVAPLQILSRYVDINDVELESDVDPTEGGPLQLSNLRIQSGAGDPAAAITRNGLKAWFDPEYLNLDPNNYSYYWGAGGILSWPDQSGNHNDAFPVSANSAGYNLDGDRGSVVVGGPLTFRLPITGWTAMTIILVSNSYTDPTWSDNAPLSWNETAGWGKTFLNPWQTSVFFRFGTTQTNNQPVYKRPVNVGADFTVTTSIHNAGTDTLFVNGVQAMQRTGGLATIAGSGANGSIGWSTGSIGGPVSYFSGGIGDILIYNRALSDAERSSIERYLMRKYAVR